MNRYTKGLSGNISRDRLVRVVPTPIRLRIILVLLSIAIMVPALADQKNTNSYSLIVQNKTICQNDTLQIRFENALPADVADSLYFVHGIDSIAFRLTDDLKLLSPPDSLKGIIFPTDRLNLSGIYTVYVQFMKTGDTETTVLSDNFELVKDVIIHQEPIDRYVCQAVEVVFSVQAENYDKIIWQQMRYGDNIWSPAPYPMTENITVTADKQTNDKTRYRAKITNKNVCEKISGDAILLIDSIKPEIECPEDIFITIDPGVCEYTIARLPSPKSITDACPTNQSELRRSDSKTNSDPYPIGITTIIYTVMDKSRNSNSCTFDITIENNEYENIPCKEKETLYLDEFCRTRILNPPDKILPPCETSPVQIYYAGTMNYTKAGDFTVRYFTTHERVLDCTTEVTVLDTLKKLKSVPEPLVTKDTDPGKCTAAVPRQDPVIQSCTPGRDQIDLITPWPADNAFPVGETTNLWQITWFDGTKDTLAQKIIVNDVTIPIVNCPEDTLEFMLDPGMCNEWQDIPGLSEGFACGPVSISNSLNGTDNVSGIFEAGYTNVTWTASHQGVTFKECPQTIVLFTRPLAADDRITIKEDEHALVRILDNDDDCFGIPGLSIEILASRLPMHGTSFLNPNSHLDYTPDTGFVGNDTIGYRILNSMGMIDSALVIITIEAKPDDPDIENPQEEPCSFLIPDGFSPNGDGIGERFYIQCIEDYPDARISIFNRYGQLLFEQEKYGNIDYWGSADAFWDGRPNRGINPFQSILPAGTYFYRFDPGNGQKPATGSIYLNTNIKGMKSHE